MDFVGPLGEIASAHSLQGHLPTLLTRDFEVTLVHTQLIVEDLLRYHKKGSVPVSRSGSYLRLVGMVSSGGPR